MNFSSYFIKRSAVAGILIASGAVTSSAQTTTTTITMESWRSEDAEIWNQKILPVFEKEHPDIKVEFKPTEPTQYDASLRVRLEGGTAGDLISCRSFDNALALYKDKYLVSIKDLAAIKNFPQSRLVAWQTDDGSDTFCVPVIGSLHGFIYNKKIFAELGAKEPATVDDFFALLDSIKKDGRYVPLAIGTKDTWAVGTMGYMNIGPQYWHGAEGQHALIAGTKKLTDPEFLGPMQAMGRWSNYLAPGYQAQGYSDSQSQFTLGRAAIYPSGSWEIPGFRKDADFDMGAFLPPLVHEGDKCYMTDHTDLGLGMNAATKHPAQVKTFLEWTGTEEFSQLLADALPGLFPLSNWKVTYKDSLAAEFASWRDKCAGSVRITYQVLARGKPSMDDDLNEQTANVVNGTISPEAAVAAIQHHLDAWYKPAK